VWNVIDTEAMSDSAVPSTEDVVVIHDQLDERVDEFLDELSDESKSEGDGDERKHVRRLAQPRMHSIELMQEIATKRGGKCLSTVYKGLGENLKWECCDGHTWEANPRNVLHHNSWCPKCRGNVGEELARATLVEAFPGKTFERTRREGCLDGLELDGYNAELKLAFEYQGIQHFERVPHFHREEGQFESQLARDALKRERCKQAGIVLLEISYKVKLNDVRTMVRKMLVDLKFSIADITMTDTEFYDMCRAGSSNNSRLELVKKIAAEKHGECLATKYISYDFKMPFRCGRGHEFMASLQDINQDRSRGPRFCPVCGGTQKKGDDEIRTRVEAIGYQLLDTKMMKSGSRNRRYLTVQCPANHEPYDVIMDNLISKDGSLRKGCSKCQHAALGKSKRFDVSSWTATTGIKLIGEFTGKTKMHQWKCPREHVFEACLNSLQLKKDPCSACWVIDYAARRDFEILSDIRGDMQRGDILKWRCLKCNEFVIEASRMSVANKDITCKVCK
jgi:hypothetical protein